MNKRKQNVLSSFCWSLYLFVFVHSLFNCWFVYSNVATRDMIWGFWNKNMCDTTCSLPCVIHFIHFIHFITRRIAHEIFPASNVYPDLRKRSSYINNLFLLCVSQPSAELSVPETTRIKHGKYFTERSAEVWGRAASSPPSSPASSHHRARKHAASSLFFSAAQGWKFRFCFLIFFYPLLLCVRPSRSPLSSRCKDESPRTDASSHSHNRRERLIHSHVNGSCTVSHFSNHRRSYVQMHQRNALSNFVVLLYNKEFYSVLFYSGWPLSYLHRWNGFQNEWSQNLEQILKHNNSLFSWQIAQFPQLWKVEQAEEPKAGLSEFLL